MNSLNLLSQYRNAIMGIAILWIFIFHLFPYECTFKYDVFRLIAKFGFAGVDIFLFISGFGLYHGFKKYKTKSQFYKKRFLRIIPTYFLFVILTLLASHNFSVMNFFCMFFNLGSFGFQVATYNWYMTAIIFLYLVFPFYINIFDKSPLKNTIITIIIVLIVNFITAPLGYNTAILITRIPIFCIGIYASYLHTNTTGVSNNKLILLVSFISLVVYTYCYYKKYDYTIFLKYGISWIPFSVIVPGILIFLTHILDRISRHIPYIIQIISFVGTISLEIYLIHVNEVLVNFLRDIAPNKFILCMNVFVVSLLGGYIIHKIMRKIIKI